jgi:hypothetical protein
MSRGRDHHDDGFGIGRVHGLADARPQRSPHNVRDERQAQRRRVLGRPVHDAVDDDRPGHVVEAADHDAADDHGKQGKPEEAPRTA